MSISSKIKRYYEKSRTDLSREQHTPEPEKNSNSNSYNSTTSSISNSHNFSPANFFVFPYVDHAETEPLAGPSIMPFLKVASRQLEAIQSQIKLPAAETETSSDSDEIPPISQAAPHQSRAARQRMTVGDNSQPPRSKTWRPEYSAKRQGKRRRTEDTLNPQSQIKVPEAEAEADDSLSDSDEIPPISQAPLHQSRAARQRMIVGDNSQTPRSKTLRPEYISAKRKGKQRRTEDTLNPAEPEPENDRVVDDRTRKETDEFVYFLYFLALCALIFFLIFLFLLSVIFLFCLYVLHLSYK